MLRRLCFIVALALMPGAASASCIMIPVGPGYSISCTPSYSYGGGFAGGLANGMLAGQRLQEMRLQNALLRERLRQERRYGAEPNYGYAGYGAPGGYGGP